MIPLRSNVVNCLSRSSATSARAFRCLSACQLSRGQIPPPDHSLQTQVPCRAFRSSQSTLRKLEQPSKPEPIQYTTPVTSQDGTRKQDQRKAPRKNAGKPSSLRRVAVEAQRSRGSFVKGKGNKRFVDPEVETKTVTAYCAAEQYNISSAARLVQAQGYELDPYQTGLYPQVIHVQTTGGSHEDGEIIGNGDIFIFPSGTVVTWNVSEQEALSFVKGVLPAAAEGSHLKLLETEDLKYIEDPSKESSEIIGDTIVLGTKAETQDSDALEETSVRHQNRNSTATDESPTSPVDETDQRHEVDTVLAKIAFSSGLARSTKLAVLESLLSAYQRSTRSIPTMLSKGSKFPTRRSKLPFTRSFILRKTGELLSIRAQLNLYSELTDSLPDIFWDSRHELGLEGYYEQVGRTLDVGVRIKVLNEKIGFAQEIASVLRESLSEKHGLRLEWAIIALIAVEVVLEFYRHWKDAQERDDPDSTESLLRKYLMSAEKERIST